MRFTPTIAAFSRAIAHPLSAASASASVVFPVPGGPWKSSDVSDPAASIRLSSFPSPRKCSWPATSSSVRGRIRTARGATRSAAASRPGAHKSGD